MTMNLLQMRKQYPKVIVEVTSNQMGKPAEIQVTYTNGKTQTISAAGKSVFDIYEDMMEYTAELEEKEEMVEMDKN